MTIVLAERSGNANLGALNDARDQIKKQGEAQVCALRRQSAIEQEGLATSKTAIDKVRNALDGEVKQVQRQTKLLKSTYDDAHAVATLEAEILYEPPSIGGIGIRIHNLSKTQAKTVTYGGEFFDINGFEKMLGYDPVPATDVEGRTIGFISSGSRSNLSRLGIPISSSMFGHVEVGCANCEDKEYWITVNYKERSVMDIAEVPKGPEYSFPPLLKSGQVKVLLELHRKAAGVPGKEQFRTSPGNH